MKAYITKHALTKGVQEVECEHSRKIAGMIEVEDELSINRTALYHSGEWWTNRAEALMYAERMRQKKLASLQRQIRKLEAMKFE